MDFDLIKVRVISFLFGLVTLVVGGIITALLTLFTGPEFQTLVTAHFGEGAVASLIFLFVQQLVAHIRNIAVLKKYTEQLGSPDEVVSHKPTLI